MAAAFGRRFVARGISRFTFWTIIVALTSASAGADERAACTRLAVLRSSGFLLLQQRFSNRNRDEVAASDTLRFNAHDIAEPCEDVGVPGTPGKNCAAMGMISTAKAAFDWSFNACKNDEHPPDAQLTLLLRLANIFIFILKCTMPAAVENGEFKQRLAKPGSICLGMVCQFMISPFCGCVLVWLLEPPAEIGLTLVILASCPGGNMSNLFCYIFNADLALSVTMTGASTLCGMLMLPVSIYIYGRLLYSRNPLDPCSLLRIFYSLGVVLVGLGIGLILSKVFTAKRWRTIFGAIGSSSGLLIFGLMIYIASLRVDPQTVDPHAMQQKKVLHSSHKNVIALTLAQILLAIGFAILLTSALRRILAIEPPQRVTIVFESVYQNTALGAVIVTQAFSGLESVASAASVTVLYQLAQTFALTVFGFCAHFSGSTYVDPTKTPIWEALVMNFQKCDPVNGHD